MKKILITGGNGYVGHEVGLQASLLGWSVISVSRSGKHSSYQLVALIKISLIRSSTFRATRTAPLVSARGWKRQTRLCTPSALWSTPPSLSGNSRETSAPMSTWTGSTIYVEGILRSTPASYWIRSVERMEKRDRLFMSAGPGIPRF
jgi:hypothetical protein